MVLTRARRWEGEAEVVLPGRAVQGRRHVAIAPTLAEAAVGDDLPPLERVAELNAPYERCGIGTCTVYLDRSTAKYFANRLDAAGL